MIISVEEAKNWLRVDGDEDDSTIEMLIRASEEYLENATGKKFDQNDNQARLFCLVLIADWYENREYIGQKVGEKARFTIQSLLAQLQYASEGDETDEI